MAHEKRPVEVDMQVCMHVRNVIIRCREGGGGGTPVYASTHTKIYNLKARGGLAWTC